MSVLKNDGKVCELLAPAGSFAAAAAAIQSGADAVYIGGQSFSARASADNFDTEDIKRLVLYAHLRGVKVHAALNTLIKQDEMHEALCFAASLYEAGVDALIVQDIGLAANIRKIMPDFDLHASTQMTIHNANDAQILKDMGYKRVVLARELNFEEIKHIKENVDIEVEMFVHGAICMSYSGQCLFSSIIGARSGNRGRCAQPCRMEYEFYKGGKKEKQGYLLSPKDMCLAEKLNEIKKAKIDSLKIEGRLKKAEYVAAVVGIYRKYIDSGKKVTKEDHEALLSAFNRSGFTDGYFTGRTGADMMSYISPSNIADEKFSKEVLERTKKDADLKKVCIDMCAEVEVGKKAYVKVTDENQNTACVYTDEVCGAAKTKAADDAYLLKQLSRLGSTVYKIRNFTAKTDGKAGIGAGELNALRRTVCEKLDKMRTDINKRNLPDIKESFDCTFKGIKTPEITVSVSNEAQARAALRHNVARIYAPEFVAKKIVNENNKDKIFIKTQDISNCETVYDKKLLSSHLCHAKYHAAGDFRLNVYNAESVKTYKNLGFGSICLSLELNFNEIKKITALYDDCEILVYGYIPLMLIKNCVLKAIEKKCCENDKEEFFLKDRKNEKFRIVCNKKTSCTNTVLNSKPLYMADKAEDIKRSGAGFARIAFSCESEDECEKILTAYENAFEKKPITHAVCFEDNNFTRGHFYRGVL